MFSSKKISPDLLEKLISLLWIDYFETNEGLILINNPNGKVSIDKINGQDKTAIESLVNHIHLSDIFDVKLSTDFVLIAKKVGDIWATKLKRDFPNHKFRIYLTCEDDIILRFHQVHDGEPNWLNEFDWKEEISSGKIFIWNF